MDAALQQAVRERAKHRCEYCHFPAAFAELPFHHDHVIAQQHGGATELDNLAFACLPLQSLQRSKSLKRGSGLIPNRATLSSASGQMGRPFLMEWAWVGWKDPNWPRHHPGLTAQSFRCGGATVEVEVPLGVCEVRYAYGEKWYGYKHLFGPATVYSKAETTFDFSSDGNRVTGYTITLYGVRDGNLQTSKISAEEF